MIQTYVSLEKSEEIQLQGRTARQGKKGTYAMILLEDELQEQLKMEKGQAAKCGPETLYELIDEARQKQLSDVFKHMNTLLQTANEKDSLTNEYFDALLTKNQGQAFKGFKDLHALLQKSRKATRRCRLMCLSDATGSMSSIWDSTKRHIQEMLRRIDEIGGGDNLDLMWVAYKDYSDDELLKKSPWTRDAKTMQKFVDSIVCGGGGDGEEAVEHALAEVMREHEKEAVTRVLLIGDAPPHWEQKGAKLTHHDKVLDTDYLCEATRFADCGIPVYAFYAVSGNKSRNKRFNSRVVSTFKEIADITSGEVEHLQSPDRLMDLICKSALDGIGGSALVAEYVQRFEKK